MRRIATGMLTTALSAAVLAAGLGFTESVSAAGAEFSYNGDTGPAYWFELSPDWAACAGTAVDARQSPVNIHRTRFDPHLKSLALQTHPTSIDMFNNGHTIEQHYEGTGSRIVFEGTTYELQQFHFHTLSEHVISGEHADMELHAVFQDAAGVSNLVVGVLFEDGKKNNPFLQTLIDAGLPAKNGDTTVTSTQIDLADVLTSTASYFTYPGSLTTPPCSETVTWVVLAKPAKMTHAQGQSFRRILGNDFRPLQDLNGRRVRSTNVMPPHGFGQDN